MARQRSEKRDKAKQIWLKSDKKRKLKDIAMDLGVSEEQIRKWKNQDKWEEQSLPNEPKKKGNVTKADSDGSKAKKNKRGAPKGNQNAIGNIGGGAPLGNKNNLKHGEYERILFNTLNDEEMDLINSMGNDSIQQLEHEVALLTVREHRLLKRIEEAKSTKLSVAGVTTTKNKVNTKGSGNTDDEMRTTAETTMSTAVSNFELISRLEEALTRVQDKKVKTIETINRIKIGWERLIMDKGGTGEHEDNIRQWLYAVTPNEEDVKGMFEDMDIRGVMDYEEI